MATNGRMGDSVATYRRRLALGLRQTLIVRELDYVVEYLRDADQYDVTPAVAVRLKGLEGDVRDVQRAVKELLGKIATEV